MIDKQKERADLLRVDLRAAEARLLRTLRAAEARVTALTEALERIEVDANAAISEPLKARTSLIRAIRNNARAALARQASPCQTCGGSKVVDRFSETSNVTHVEPCPDCASPEQEGRDGS